MDTRLPKISGLDKMLAPLSVGGTSGGAYLILEGIKDMNPGYIAGGGLVIATGLISTGVVLYRNHSIKNPVIERLK